ncbi:MAG: hypothetical protein AVDCRST_MAG67-3652, partial [uncultured Solirubrobacteraceae bacterium]
APAAQRRACQRPRRRGAGGAHVRELVRRALGVGHADGRACAARAHDRARRDARRHHDAQSRRLDGDVGRDRDRRDRHARFVVPALPRRHRRAGPQRRCQHRRRRVPRSRLRAADPRRRVARARRRAHDRSHLVAPDRARARRARRAA